MSDPLSFSSSYLIWRVQCSWFSLRFIVPQHFSLRLSPFQEEEEERSLIVDLKRHTQLAVAWNRPLPFSLYCLFRPSPNSVINVRLSAVTIDRYC